MKAHVDERRPEKKKGRRRCGRRNRLRQNASLRLGEPRVVDGVGRLLSLFETLQGLWIYRYGDECI